MLTPLDHRGTQSTQPVPQDAGPWRLRCGGRSRHPSPQSVRTTSPATLTNDQQHSLPIAQVIGTFDADQRRQITPRSLS